MKHYTLFFIVSLLIGFSGKAQNTFPSSGNVGIGTTTPGTNLVVNGNARFLSRLTIGADEDPPSFMPLQIKGTAQSSAQIGFHDVNRPVDERQWVLINQGGKFRILTEKDDYSAIQEAFVITRTGLNVSKVYFPNGNVGVGTNSPETPFHVNGESRFNGLGWFSRNNNGAQNVALNLGQNLNYDYPVVQISTSDNGGSNSSYWFGTRWGHHVQFQRSSSIGTKTMIQLGGDDGMHYISVFSTDGSTEKIRLVADGASWLSGSVGIGTTNLQGYKLAVNGDAIFTKVKVKQYANWPDYVFHPAYNLRSLSELEQFIQQNKHLPGIPSATEVEKNGLDLGENQASLLKTIEELTLYVIDLKKEIDGLQKELKELKTQKN